MLSRDPACSTDTGPHSCGSFGHKPLRGSEVKLTPVNGVGEAGGSGAAQIFERMTMPVLVDDLSTG